MKRFISFLIFLIPFCASIQTTDSLVVGRVTQYYFTLRAGEPVLNFRGRPGLSSHQKDVLAQELAKQYKTILFDERGTGRSWNQTMDSSTMHIDAACADLDVVRKQLHIDQFTFPGHVWGAMLAST